MPVGSYQGPPYTSLKRRGQSPRVAQVCVFVIWSELLISRSSSTWTGGCFPLLEPVNRATAAREFRVFHAALHSLNSTYRDSVSRTHRNTCWKWKKQVKTRLRSFFPAHFAQLVNRKKLKIEISEERYNGVSVSAPTHTRCRCTKCWRIKSLWTRSSWPRQGSGQTQSPWVRPLKFNKHR